MASQAGAGSVGKAPLGRKSRKKTTDLLEIAELAPNLYNGTSPRKTVYTPTGQSIAKVRSGIKLEMSEGETTDDGNSESARGGGGGKMRGSFRGSPRVQSPDPRGAGGGGRLPDELQPLRSALAQTTHFNPDFGSIRKYSDRLLKPHRQGRLESHDFPGFGGAFMLKAPEDQLRAIERQQKSRHSEHDKLSEWLTTAICGNDILSSCLYVSGVVTAEAGILSPVCLAMVAGILYLMRFVYGEAITALPMNGGSYNLLLNTASKPVASVAACLAIISYIATAVVSGTSAVEYLKTVVPALDVDTCTIGLLFAFAALAYLGISESAAVALALFVAHVATLAALCAGALAFLLMDGSVWRENWQNREYPDVIVAGQVLTGGVGTALFFGMSAAMLGVSGFESAAQYVQEQKPGVFVKCLRNMWCFVAVFNPLISALSFCTLTVADIEREENHVLSSMAFAVGAKFQEALGTDLPLAQAATTWVALDAFLVLSGAVLTAYVGVNGLIRRMAADRVLPQLLLRRNAWRRTNHYIIFGFFLLCTSQVLLLQGDTVELAGVYTFAFMGVMCIFTTGTMMLKAKRSRLPRDVAVPWPAIVAALALLLAALVGNILSKPAILSYFFLYVGVVGIVIFSMFQRLNISRLMFSMIKKNCGAGSQGEGEGEGDEEAPPPGGLALAADSPLARARAVAREGPCLRWLRGAMVSMSETPYVFFCKYDDLYQINKAIIYVQKNEVTRHILIVNVCGPGHPEPEELPEHIEMFDVMYPKVKISLLTVVGDFGPPLVEWLSLQLEVPQNMMFITCPDSQFKHKISSLGGVRVISH